MSNAKLPVAVIGAGPVGLAAAAHLVARGETPLVLEAGATAAASVLKWGHVRIFSPWRHNVDTAAAALLEGAGWARPPHDVCPTGDELVEHYLAPLAALPAIRPHVRLRTRVLGVSRLGRDRTRTAGRADAPFVLRVEADGVQSDVLARAVIDASGTYESPNPLGGNGLPAIGEGALADRVFYGIPDVLRTHRERYAGRHVLVVGNGHSAFNVLLDLATLAEQERGTRITWAVRRPSLDHVFGGGQKDQLEERGRLGLRMRALAAQGVIEIVTDFSISRLEAAPGGVVVHAGDRRLGVDTVVAATGFRPDVAMLRELRLDLDPIVESPAILAPLIDPNVHSCGTVPPHGAAELRQPEEDFYVVGMKSYGRAPTFLMLTGYEQVRSVVAALTGDVAGARDVRLVLPETGVCSVPTAARVLLPLAPGAARTGCC
jgi:cation diffusion facilitator CzcD-associated flavoprotein CzcO